MMHSPLGMPNWISNMKPRRFGSRDRKPTGETIEVSSERRSAGGSYDRGYQITTNPKTKEEMYMDPYPKGMILKQVVIPLILSLVLASLGVYLVLNFEIL